MKNILLALVLLLYAWTCPGQADTSVLSQTTEERIAVINGIIDRNHTQNFPWLKQQFYFVSSDLLGMTTTPAKVPIPTIPYINIICINTMKSGNLHTVVLYIRSGTDSSVRSCKILFDRPDSMPELISQFNNLFTGLGKKPPTTTCMWYENDLFAQNFEARLKEFKDNDYGHPIWGIDSLCSGFFIINYVDGKKRYERNVVNGLFHGRQTEYHPNGVLAFEGNYVNGLAEGVLFRYDENGNKVSEQHYKNGMEHGFSLLFFEHGQINVRSTFEMGVLIKEEAFNEDGTPQGPSILFREEIPEK